MGKGEIACYEQFLLFPHCFQKAGTANTEKAETQESDCDERLTQQDTSIYWEAAVAGNYCKYM